MSIFVLVARLNKVSNVSSFFFVVVLDPLPSPFTTSALLDHLGVIGDSSSTDTATAAEIKKTGDPI